MLNEMLNEVTMERVVAPKNMRTAYLAVKANGESGGFVVRIGGRTFYPKLTRVRLTTETEFELESGDRRIPGVVRSLGPMWFLPRMKYSVVVDDSEVAQDMQTPRCWYLCYLASGVLFVVLMLAALGAWALILAFLR